MANLTLIKSDGSEKISVGKTTYENIMKLQENKPRTQKVYWLLKSEYDKLNKKDEPKDKGTTKTSNE